jgi:hypothetical protein
MPAIDLSRLKTQAALLAENFSNHPLFIHQLHELLELYTNHTMRAAQVARHLSLPTYHTPAPVLRQIERELVPLADQFPSKAVLLAYELWKDGSLESRLLAARLAGMIPPASAIPLLSRFPGWLAHSTDKEVRQALVTDSFARIRRENPGAFFMLLEEWLRSPRPAWQVWGMQALIPLLKDPDFQNLPAVFRILRPAILAAGPTTQLDLQACLAALEGISLTETIVHLRDILTAEPSPLLLRTMRRMLPAFSPELQRVLRDLLREQGA